MGFPWPELLENFRIIASVAMQTVKPDYQNTMKEGGYLVISRQCSRWLFGNMAIS
jgi:hypothetical protein